MGDLFMRLIHTCELNGANSFRYLAARSGIETNSQRLDAVELHCGAGRRAVASRGVVS